MRLEGKKAVVTGGGGGIGRAIIRAFSREGAQICVVDLSDEVTRGGLDRRGRGGAFRPDGGRVERGGAPRASPGRLSSGWGMSTFW